jgi:hypothetical protein
MSEPFPLYLSVADVTKLDQRKGSYSKTITLAGSKNNGLVLGSLFDVNVVDSTFNINKKIRCDVYQDGVNVFPRAYFQLKRVVKSGQATATSFDKVEYTGIVYNDVVDFFKEMGNKELTDLRIANASNSHELNLTNIEASYDHDADDVYYYPTYYNWSNVYFVNQFFPAVFAKVYFDAIFEQAGFTYEWDELGDFGFEFDKCIIPFTGKFEPSPETRKANSVNVGTDLNQDFDNSPVEESLPTLNYPFFARQAAGTIQNSAGFITYPINFNTVPVNGAPVATYRNPLTTENLDPKNQYDNTTGVFTSAFNTEFDIAVTFDYTLNLDAQDDATITENLQIDIIPYYTKNNVNIAQYGSVVSLQLPQGQILDNGSNLFSGSGVANMVVQLQENETIEIIGFGLRVGFNNTPFRIEDSGGDLVDVEPILDVTSVNVNILPRVNYEEGITIWLNDFIPRKIKQSDFVKSVLMMYNLLPIVDEDNPRNIKLIPRDAYFDAGKQYDWSQLLSRDKDFEVEFLPNVISKSVELSYKQDKDPHNEAYRGATGETYGQLRYVFECENTKGTDRRELVFSPTPQMRTWFNAFAPALPLVENDYNIRILYANGRKSVEMYVKEKGQASPTLVEWYGEASHFNRGLNPSLDLNFGIAQFYFYQGVKPTLNTLFNLHYRRTMKQINEGKRAIGYFNLDPLRVATIRLNDRIYINNSWWTIEEIAYNASDKNLTKVTLLTIDDETSIKPVRGSVSNQPIGVIDANIGVPIGDDVIVRPTQEMVQFTNQASNTYGGDHPYLDVQGRGNVIRSGAGGLIIGDNNDIQTPNALVVGDGHTVTESGIYTDNLFIDGKNVGEAVGEVIYKARVIQSGTNAPTLTEYLNPKGYTITTGYSSAGNYTLAGFTDETFLSGGKYETTIDSNFSELHNSVLIVQTNTQLGLITRDSANTFTNGILANTGAGAYHIITITKY